MPDETLLTLLIDGDMVAWLVASTARAAEDCGSRAVRWVNRQMRDLHAGRAIICLSDPSRHYFRHAMFPNYKPRRNEVPEGYIDAINAMTDACPTRWLPSLEADDVIGILATCGTLGQTVIVAIDKDLLTVPGLHFNPHATARGIVATSERDADYNHLRQTLVGDSGDGYGGCPGIGPQTVRRILWGEPWQWWGQCLMAFRARGLTEADALLQARLARILRSEDYDLEKRRVIGWNPRNSTEALSHGQG